MKYELIAGLIVLGTLAGCGAPQSMSQGTPIPQTYNYSIQVNVTDISADSSLNRGIYIILDNDTNTKNGYILQYNAGSGTTSKTFTITGVAQTPVYIWAYKDVNTSYDLGQFDDFSDVTAVNATSYTSTMNASLVISHKRTW